jgi:hypothetical protein
MTLVVVSAGDLAFWRDRLEGSSRHGLFLLLAQVRPGRLHGVTVAAAKWGLPYKVCT